MHSYKKIKKVMDNLANLFSKIQNGQNLYKTIIQVPFSKKSWNISNILFIEGLIKGFCLKENFIYIFLKYSQNKPVITKIKKISLQGRRLYSKKLVRISLTDPINELYESSSPISSSKVISPSKQKRNLHFFKLRLLSTSKGIMTERDAKFFGIGGEILCDIF